MRARDRAEPPQHRTPLRRLSHRIPSGRPAMPWICFCRLRSYMAKPDLVQVGLSQALPPALHPVLPPHPRRRHRKKSFRCHREVCRITPKHRSVMPANHPNRRPREPRRSGSRALGRTVRLQRGSRALDHNKSIRQILELTERTFATLKLPIRQMQRCYW
jgi:hypothetical protein